jgi:hypothetical protein
MKNVDRQAQYHEQYSQDAGGFEEKTQRSA